MPQSGQEMLEESIGNCRRIADGLGPQNAAWTTSLVEIIEKFEESNICISFDASGCLCACYICIMKMRKN